MKILNGRADQSGKTDKGIVLLEYLIERSGERFSKLEAFLDILDKAKEQYVPKDLCK
ncbi:MAG: hypothetical protein LUC26_02915 [Prevotella sp.]|nr:hypothetical protein [Prevotella sp.]